MNTINQVILKQGIIVIAISSVCFVFFLSEANAISCSEKLDDYRNQTDGGKITLEEAQKRCNSAISGMKILPYGVLLSPVFYGLIIHRIKKLEKELYSDLAKQGDKCLRCGSSINDPLDAYYDDDKVYCQRCGEILFPDEKKEPKK